MADWSKKLALARRCVELKSDLCTAGLYESMQAMEAVVTRVGWEIAAQMEKDEKGATRG